MITLPTDSLAVKEGYYFDAALAAKRIAYLTKQFDVKLYHWQHQELETYFGWVNDKQEYRYTKWTTFIPKKNGKSWLISLLLNFKLLELKNSRLYSCAYNSQQAGIICDGSINLFRRSPMFKALLEKNKQLKGVCSKYRKEIEFLPNNNKYVSLADSINANDGLIAHVMIIDEIHRMKKALIDVCMGATTNIPNALRVIISTAGDGDRTHPSTQHYELAKKVLNGDSKDIHLLPDIWECSDEVKTEAEIYCPKRLIAANPVLQEDAQKRKLALAELEEAREIRKDAWWKRFRLNQFLPQDGDEYIDPPLYERCEAPEPDLNGLDVWIGIDKGGIWDFTGIVFVFRLEDGSLWEKHFTFAVADKIAKMQDADDTDYQEYIDKEELIIIPSDVVMDQWITDWIIENVQPYNVQLISSDGWRDEFILESLATAGHEVRKSSQGNNRQLSPVIDDYFNKILQGKLKHKANSLIDWQLTNCRRIVTAKDVYKLVKAGSNSKGKGGYGHIDNIDAAIVALQAYRSGQVSEVTYDGGIVVA